MQNKDSKNLLDEIPTNSWRRQKELEKINDALGVEAKETAAIVKKAGWKFKQNRK